MFIQSSRSLLGLSTKTIPIVESRQQLAHAIDTSRVNAILLRHCNLFECTTLLGHAYQRGLPVYVNVDHIDGIHSDAAGLRYLAEQLHIAGVLSNHPKILVLAKNFGLETIQRIFAVDSTGLEMSLESVDAQYVDLLEISPALVVPYAIPNLLVPLPLPFIASGLVNTAQQVQAVLRAGALAVAVTRTELWQ